MKNITFGLAITLAALSCAVISSAFADETPPHTIAVMGRAELLLPPDFATIQVGVITQGASVADALADNNARMRNVVDAIGSLGIADTDVHTSDFNIEPRYAPRQPNDYDPEELRTVIGYYIANKVTVRVSDLTKVAKIIDASVQAGANASGKVDFQVRNLTEKMDDARRAAVENAHHKAQVLTAAGHVILGATLSITDNEADRSYSGFRGLSSETVVVTGSRMPETPILPGLISLTAQVTVLYAVK